MKKLVLSLSIAFGALALASCANNAKTTSSKETSKTTTTSTSTTSTSTSTTSKKDITYTVTVVDIDGEVLVDNLSLETKEGSNSIIEDLKKANIDIVSYETNYGTSISTIASSVVDDNYYLAFYVNDEYSQVGAPNYEIQDGDSLKFISTCWNTIDSGYGFLDSYDVLVDKTLYHYAKTYMQDFIKADTTYASSDYWTYMTINLMQDSYFGTNSFDARNATNELVKSIEDTDVKTLTGANIAKYYWTSKALGYDTSALESNFGSLISSHIEGSYSELTSPFIISPAYNLGYTSNELTDFVDNATQASTQYGTDSLAWQVATLGMFDKYSDTTVLDNLNSRSQNGTSTAVQLMAYAALGVSPRDSKYEVDDKDLVEFLFDEFYSEDLDLVKVYKDDEGSNMSTNQIYAALAAYKVSRDLINSASDNTKAFIFA